MRSIPVLAVAALLVLPTAAWTQDTTRSRSWTEEKCVRYRDAWTGALARWGREGLSRDFIARHEAFIAGGCTGESNVCPRSAREIELANVLTIRAMNAGMASTFLPFACRD